MAWHQSSSPLNPASNPARAESADEHMPAMPAPLPRRQRQHAAALLAVAAAFLCSLVVVGSRGRVAGRAGGGVVLDGEDGAISMEKKCCPAQETDGGGSQVLGF